ncbi:MAG: hypothetical protein Q9216_000181 [Gyalolechia sp. 2 TL-2023]
MSSNKSLRAAANGKAKENTPAADSSSKTGQSAPKDQTSPPNQSSSGTNGAAAKGKVWDKDKQEWWLKCLNDHRSRQVER